MNNKKYFPFSPVWPNPTLEDFDLNKFELPLSEVAFIKVKAFEGKLFFGADFMIFLYTFVTPRGS